MTNTNTKLTKVEKFGMVVSVLATVEGNEMLVDFINDEIARLEKASATKKANRKPTKAQLENAGFIAQIVEVLEGQENFLSANEIAVACGFDFSSQKMTALMKQVEGVEKGQATSDKKKVGYKIVTE